MNLVQINERLKDLPMQVLQQYANGMNPEVPPYLALGELQRRETAQKQMATAQGAAQGPQPSVKEQVEQKAGLMELQQMQQQQMAQQMQQPRGPMPAPAGVPQPEMQPEVMMARGGLAGIPVRRDMFEYAGGGIIAFQEGGQPKYEARYDKMNRENREQAAKDEPRVINVPPGTPAQEVEMIRLQNPDAVVRTGEEGGKIQALLDKLKSAATYSSDVEAMKQRERVASAPSGGVSEAQASAMAGPQAQMPAGLPAALQKASPVAAAPRPAAPVAGAAPMPGAPRPAPQAGAPVATSPAQAGLPGALPQGVSPFMAEAAASAREKPTAPTAEGVIAEQRKLLPEAMQEAAMQKRAAEQRERAQGRQAAYEKSQPTGLDNLIRVLGQAGQYKGFSGIGPAYTALQQQRRAEDLAMQKQQDELMTAIEGREYEGGKALYEPRAKSMDAANKAYQDRLMTNTKTLADLAGVDQRRMDEALNRLSQEKLERLRIAARAAEANRPGEAERIEARYAGLIAQGKTQEAEAYLDRISRIKGGSSAAGERNDIAAVKAEQSALQKELENLALPKDVRATKQKQLDDTYVKLRNLSGGGGQSQQAGKVVDFSSLPK